MFVLGNSLNSERENCVCVCVVKERLGQEQEQLRQECLHLRSRLDAAQSECQKEREVRDGGILKREVRDGGILEREREVRDGGLLKRER